MRKRRGTFQKPPQPPWWSAPVFLLPVLVSLGLIVMVLVLRLLGYPE
jgi:hypothetical protein